jgi:hypothetical protein
MRALSVVRVLALVAPVTAFAQAAPAPPAAPPAPPAAAPAMPIAGAIVGDVVQWKGVVMAVNQKSRHVIVKGDNGHLHQFVVPASVPNLDKVAKGDSVNLAYVESIAIYVHDANAPAGAATANAVTIAPHGMPAVSEIAVKEDKFTVTAIDQAKRELTVTGSMGNTRTVEVDPSVKEFAKLKVGDVLIVRATEAVAVSIAK